MVMSGVGGVGLGDGRPAVARSPPTCCTHRHRSPLFGWRGVPADSTGIVDDIVSMATDCPTLDSTRLLARAAFEVCAGIRPKPTCSVADVLSNAQQALDSKLMLPTDQAVLLGPIAALKWEAADDIEAEHRSAVGDLRFLESRSSKRATRAGPPRWPIWPRRGPPQTCSAHSHPRQARHRRPLVDHHGRRCFVSDGAAMTYYAVSPPAHQGR